MKWGQGLTHSFRIRKRKARAGKLSMDICQLLHFFIGKVRLKEYKKIKFVRKLNPKAGGDSKASQALTLNNTGGRIPNGRNDVFTPVMMGVDEYQIYIYDRYDTLYFSLIISQHSSLSLLGQESSLFFGLTAFMQSP